MMVEKVHRIMNQKKGAEDKIKLTLLNQNIIK